MRPEYLIAYASFGSVFIPLAIAIAYRKKLSVDLSLIGLILCFSFFADAISFLLIQWSINTYLIANIFLMIQFLLIGFIFKRQFKTKQIVNVILFLVALFSIINIIFFQGPWIFNSMTNVLACLILIIFSMYYLYRLLFDLPIVHIHRLPMLWISFGVLTYYGGNFFLFLVKNYLTYGDAGTHKLMWILHNLLNITKNVIFTIALWQGCRKVNSSILSSSVP